MYPLRSQYRRDRHAHRHGAQPHPHWSAKKVGRCSSVSTLGWQCWNICWPSCCVVTFQTVTSSILAPGLLLRSHSWFSSCCWGGFGSLFSMGDWQLGNVTACSSIGAFPIRKHPLHQSVFICFFYSFIPRLCSKKNDMRAQFEARAQALIREDYRKLGPIK